MTRVTLAELLTDLPTHGDEPPMALAVALSNLLAHRHVALGGDPADAPLVRRVARAVCLADAAGHACLPLDLVDTYVRAASSGEVSSTRIEERAGPAGGPATGPRDHVSLQPDTPSELGAWRVRLAASPVVAVTDLSASAPRPLVLDPQGRVYTGRYWAAECALAARWAELHAAAPLWTDADATRALLDRLFPHASMAHEASSKPAPDWQRAAVALALTRRAVVLSGGPGTGKTTTVVRMMAALLTLAPQFEVALVAPTGKAAARLQESVREQFDALPIDDATRARLPRRAGTVHALLGIGGDGARPRFDRTHPLAADVVIVDEASMLGLMLAARLFDALKPGARLVLVGDRSQLASVESGIVLATLAQARTYSPALRATFARLGSPIDALADDADGPARDAVVWLEHSRRFGADSGIGRAARAINDGDMAALRGVLDTAPDARCAGAGTSAEIAAAAFDGYRDFVEAVRASAAPVEVLDAFDRHRVLCALRDGPRGAAGLNAALAQRMRTAVGLSAIAGPNDVWFHGRPVLVTRNDAVLQVFNGDIGVCLAAGDGALAVHFRAADGTLRTFAPGGLDACDDAFALTVHKAQGSEFDTLDIVLPEQDARVLTRELLYTALTRARRTVRLWADPVVLAATVARYTVRHAGLDDRLREIVK